LLQDFSGDRGAGNRGLTQRDAIATHDQDGAELHDLAGIALDLLDLDHVLGGDAVLLAAGSDDCEHWCVLVVDSGARGRSGLLLSSRVGFAASIAPIRDAELEGSTLKSRPWPGA
jgi:hypothetical protein